MPQNAPHPAGAAMGTAVMAVGVVIGAISLVRLIVTVWRHKRGGPSALPPRGPGSLAYAWFTLAVGVAIFALGVAIFATSLP